MDTENKSVNSWPFYITIAITLFIFMTGIIVNIVTNGVMVTFGTILEIILSTPYLWILVIQVIIFPLIVYYYTKFQRTQLIEVSTNLSEQEKKSKVITNYISHLIEGQYDEHVDLDENDKLGTSLINLRDALKTNKELVDKQRKEDENRNWHAEGHAKFGEILRNNNNMENLAFSVVKELTNYTNAIQAGFYHLEKNEGKQYFDLVAFYAYGRKKYADKKLPWGKGLIGTSAIEGKTIHMDKLPESYISVTSGLGKSNPREIVVAPLISEKELFGVLEIATLNTFTSDQVSFIEKVAESTASTLSTVRMNMRTALLLEESKEQAAALSSQEEEMRQNMEELKATQEEAARQADRFLKLENTVNHTMIRAEYSVDGILIYANINFLKKLEYTGNAQVEGKHISMFISKKDIEWFNNIWQDLSKGGRHFEGYMKHVSRTGKDVWTMATYTCIRNEEGEVDRILFLALDTTEQKQLSLNLEGFMDAVNRSSLNIEFDTNGNIKANSENFYTIFKYNDREISKLNVFDLIDPMELELFNKKWENIVNGMNFEGQFKVKSKSDDELWMHGAFSAVYNMYNEVEKVVYIGHDITTQKLMEIEFKEQNKVLKQHEQSLRESEKELSKKLRQAKLEMQEQFKEIENIKIRNERTLEGALDAIIQTTQTNQVIFYNKAAENLLGFSNQEIIGKDISELFSENEIKNDDFIGRYTKPGDEKLVGMRTEIKMQHKDGTELSVLILLSRAQVEKEITYTAFIQTIEVELF